jgi:hypothetical protein
MIEEAGAPNFCIIFIVYLMINSFTASLAEGSMTLKSKILKEPKLKFYNYCNEML